MQKDYDKLARGSRVAAIYRRSGGRDLIIQDGKPRGTRPRNWKTLEPLVRSHRDELVSFLECEALDADFDQSLALERMKEYISPLTTGDLLDEEPGKPVAVIGEGGSGKTHLIGQICAYATDHGLRVIVAAPTNKALGPLTESLARAGLDGNALVTVSTVHRAVKSMRLTAAGHDLADHLTGDAPEEAFTGDNTTVATAAEIRQILAQRRPSAARDKAFEACLSQISGMDNVPAQAYAKLFQIAGFPALDERLVVFENGEPDCDVILVDEVSMIGELTIKAIAATGCRVILFGDPVQLPPVKLEYRDRYGAVYSDQSAIMSLDPNRTFYLQRSRRQASSSIIPEVAHEILHMEPPEVKKYLRAISDEFPDQISFHRNVADIDVGDLRNGVTLAWRNITRHRLQREIRTLVGMSADRIDLGDRLLVSLRNDGAKALDLVKDEFLDVIGVKKEMGVDTFKLRRVGDGKIVEAPVTLYDDTAAPGARPELEYMSAIRNADFTTDYRGEDLCVGFAWAMTTHKSQGGQWDVANIMLSDILANSYDDGIPAEDGSIWPAWRRLLYTALTRAKSRINLI